MAKKVMLYDHPKCGDILEDLSNDHIFPNPRTAYVQGGSVWSDKGEYLGKEQGGRPAIKGYNPNPQPIAHNPYWDGN